jgi:hypothetical protein
MSNFSDDEFLDTQEKEAIRFYGNRALVWITIILIGSIALSGLYSIFYYNTWLPWQTNAQTNVTRHSLQYFSSQVTGMENYMTDFQNLQLQVDEGQFNGLEIGSVHASQKADIQQIYQLRDMIPNDLWSQLPTDVQDFMSNHPRNWGPNTLP